MLLARSGRRVGFKAGSFDFFAADLAEAVGAVLDLI